MMLYDTDIWDIIVPFIDSFLSLALKQVFDLWVYLDDYSVIYTLKKRIWLPL